MKCMGREGLTRENFDFNYEFVTGAINPLNANPTKWSNTLKILQNWRLKG